MDNIQPLSVGTLSGSCHLPPAPAVLPGPESPISSSTGGAGDAQDWCSSPTTLSVIFSFLSCDYNLGENHRQTKWARAQAKGSPSTF